MQRQSAAHGGQQFDLQGLAGREALVIGITGVLSSCQSSLLLNQKLNKLTKLLPWIYSL